jgi:C-terminal processing protease CtpA/Prc
LIEQSNVPVGFDIELQDDPYLPTDSSSFNTVSIPTLNFFTGSHEDYHRPTDTADKINYSDLERIAQLGALVASRVSRMPAAPEFVAVERKVEQGGGRDGLRAFTGTIPDYGTEVEGLLLSGVIEGGPAEEGGLQGGDVIVEFGKQKISNIYDYTYALDAVKIGEPISVVFVRDGERQETTITPRARD